MLGRRFATWYWTASTATFSGLKKYVVIFLYDFSRKIWVVIVRVVNNHGEKSNVIIRNNVLIPRHSNQRECNAQTDSLSSQSYLY